MIVWFWGLNVRNWHEAGNPRKGRRSATRCIGIGVLIVHPCGSKVLERVPTPVIHLEDNLLKSAQKGKLISPSFYFPSFCQIPLP